MSERQGSRKGKEEGRSYAGEQSHSGRSPDSTRSADLDLRERGDAEVWSTTMEATITDADVEAGESRRAEQFED